MLAWGTGMSAGHWVVPKQAFAASERGHRPTWGRARICAASEVGPARWGCGCGAGSALRRDRARTGALGVHLPPWPAAAREAGRHLPALCSSDVSLDIDVDAVVEVLLADGWHVVHDKTFELDAFEFTHEGRRVHGGGDSGVCATGFSFIIDEAGSRLSGPLTSVLAVRRRA